MCAINLVLANVKKLRPAVQPKKLMSMSPGQGMKKEGRREGASGRCGKVRRASVGRMGRGRTVAARWHARLAIN